MRLNEICRLFGRKSRKKMKSLKQKQLPYRVYDLIPSQQSMYMMVKYSFHKQLV